MPNNHELRDKRITVTGGAGFLGSFVVERLQEIGAEVFVPRSKCYDLTRFEDIKSMLDCSQPDVIVHLAARVGGIGANQADPAGFFYRNLLMGIQLLHEAWRWGVRKLVTVGSICSYPKYAPIPFCENDLWNGYPEETNAPYGLAKKMLLVQSQAYRQQHGFNSVVLFPVNLYGPRDNFDLGTSHVIPALIRKFLEAKARSEHEVVLWGDGTPTREFLYVEDAAEGIVLATERYDSSDPVNLGSGKEISIADLANKIRELCEFEGGIIWDSSKPNGQPRRCLNVSRAREQFGFVARTDFSTGLRTTIDWYKARA